MTGMKLYIEITDYNQDVLYPLPFINPEEIKFVRDFIPEIAPAPGVHTGGSGSAFVFTETSPKEATYIQVLLTHKTLSAIKNLLPKKPKDVPNDPA